MPRIHYFTVSVLLSLLVHSAAWAETRAISSLGRLEPKDGVIQLAGPSGNGNTGGVIKELLVAEGDWVEQDQVIARMDNYRLRTAEVARLNAILANAKSEMDRQNNLAKTSSTSKVKLDATIMDLDIAKADLAAAEAGLELATVRAPLRAQVLEIYAYPGERIGPEGIMDLGRTDQMYAVAEVYETDIIKVKPGQIARVRTAALAEPLTGKVERIALKVGRLDVLGTDPIAKTDARVVEVFILLEKNDVVSRLTNMQVEVEIQL